MKDLNIKLNHVTKSFGRPVLRDINLCVDNDSYISILGTSGCGKSTLLNIIGLVENRDSGDYSFNGAYIRRGKDYSRLRRESIGFIFQAYNLIPSLTCIENITLPLLYTRRAVDKSNEWLERMELAHLKHQRVATLSGGEKQRVAIIRALILDPCLIIADEPTGNLDSENSSLVFDILSEEHRKGRGIILITHNEQAASRAKTILRLREGVLHES